MKRVFDLITAFVLLIVTSPLFLIFSALILLDSNGSVFYCGRRVGLYGKEFRIIKFRTMVVDAEKIGGPSTSDRDPRITRIGFFLRKFKLDELPQLINVLIGNMSFVGPRPEVRKYVDMYTEEERAILSLRPGITDWASLANPDEGSVLAKYDDPDKAYEEVIRPMKLRLQLKYVRERTFFGDISIILRTIVSVFRRRPQTGIISPVS